MFLREMENNRNLDADVAMESIDYKINKAWFHTIITELHIL